MIREQIKKRRKHDPHHNIPLVTETATVKALSYRHVLYIMFILYTEGGMGPKEIAGKIGSTERYVAAVMTRLRRRGLVNARYRDAYSRHKLYFMNDKNSLLVAIMDNLSKKYGKVVIKGMHEYEGMMAHIDAYINGIERNKRTTKKARTR